MKYEDTEIQACHRVGLKHDTTIICKFGNRKLRDAFLQKRKQTRNISGKDLGLKAKDVKVFINESLTRKNKYLFKLARDKKKEIGWDFVWTRNGVIFARKNKDAAFVTIRNELDLHNYSNHLEIGQREENLKDNLALRHANKEISWLNHLHP